MTTRELVTTDTDDSQPVTQTRPDDPADTDARYRCASRIARTVAVVLLVVLSSTVSVGILSGAPSPQHPDTAVSDSGTSDSVVSNCSPDTGTGNQVAWHVERYGTGCHENEFMRFPEGEQIDRIGDPPWVPL